MIGRLIDYVKSLFAAKPKEDAVDRFLASCLRTIKEPVRIKSPLKYVKVHGNVAQYNKAKRAAARGDGVEVRRIASQVEAEKQRG